MAHTVNQLAVKTMDRRNRERAKNLFQVKFDFYQDHYDRGDHYDETPFQSSDMYVWLVLVMGVFYTIPALQVNQQPFNNGRKQICCFPLAACTELRARVDLNGKSRSVFLQLSVRKTSEPILGGFRIYLP